MPENDYPRKVYDAIEGATFEFGGLLENELNIFLNREDLTVSRKMQESIVSEVRRSQGDLEVLVGPDIFYAEYVHEGTDPHFPPPSELIDWVLHRGFASGEGSPQHRAFLLALHISREGTEPNPFLERFNDQKGEELAGRFTAIVEKRKELGN